MPVDTLNHKRINLAAKHIKSENFAMEACALAEKARELAREIHRKQAIFQANKKAHSHAERTDFLV